MLQATLAPCALSIMMLHLLHQLANLDIGALKKLEDATSNHAPLTTRTTFALKPIKFVMNPLLNVNYKLVLPILIVGLCYVVVLSLDLFAQLVQLLPNVRLQEVRPNTAILLIMDALHNNVLALHLIHLPQLTPVPTIFKAVKKVCVKPKHAVL
jgi:hypothetical protein